MPKIHISPIIARFLAISMIITSMPVNVMASDEDNFYETEFNEQEDCEISASEENSETGMDESAEKTEEISDDSAASVSVIQDPDTENTEETRNSIG